MHGGAVRLARFFNEGDYNPDLIIATDMLDVTTFLSLTRKKTAHIPIATYFHENQLTYPWSPTDKDTKTGRDKHYRFINYVTALTSDINLFNSHYHMDSFNTALPPFLRTFPDLREGPTVLDIKNKCRVLYLGLDLKRFDQHKMYKKNSEPVILWNHRWDYDKNPEIFFESLLKIKRDNIPFKLIVTGEEHGNTPEIFFKAQKELEDNILHFGYADSFEHYAELLWMADIIPVTSNQDFFGISIMEAVYCDCIPLLPKRLTYPELFNAKRNKDFFYRDDEEFYKKLKLILGDITKYKFDNFSKIATTYDWTERIDEYDDLFESLC